MMLVDCSGSGGPRQQVERERRLRREIANSNERRRMQSINHGYNMLKNMLPVTDGSEKLSKVSYLESDIGIKVIGPVGQSSNVVGQ